MHNLRTVPLAIFLALLMLLVPAMLNRSVLLAQEFDLTPYQQTIASDATIPAEILYPPFFRGIDAINLKNIYREIRSRVHFFAGLRLEPSYFNCYKMQRRIDKALERMVEDKGGLPFSSLDDLLLYGQNSPLEPYLRPMPLKSETSCTFKSFGDLRHGGIIYCAYHGPDVNGSFYKEHFDEISRARPIFTSFDMVELLIFLPALLILPFIWWISKKALQRNQPVGQESQG